MKILQDTDVRARIDFAQAIRVVEQALIRRDQDNFVSPPRLYIGNHNGDLTFTVGGDRDSGAFGFRVYPRFRGVEESSQFTAIFDASNGTLRAIVLGDYLGAARTGAIGGVAIKHLAPQSVEVLAVIGAGVQAETQIRAACQVRQFKEIRVFSRTRAAREKFVERMSELVAPEVIATDTVASALRDCQVLITATSSKRPVFDIADLPPNVHINAVGPKYSEAHELPAEISQRSPRWITDSPEQLASDGPPAFLADLTAAQIEDLSSVMQSALVGGPTSGISIFLSVGLSGTEPLVAETLL